MTSFRSEALGRRIARLRAASGHTQQDVAGRLGLSRNAVSHVETGLSHPSERTVVLLAGLFGIEPHDLVAGTDYPQPKADRLPSVAARYTEVEARLVALELELRWIDQLEPHARARGLSTLLAELEQLERGCAVEERGSLARARAELVRRLSADDAASA